MNLNNYGSTVAAKRLVCLLKQLPKGDFNHLNSKFQSLFSDYRISLKELEKIQDKRTFIQTNLFMRNYYLDTITVIWYQERNSHHLYPQIFSYFENVIRTNHKEAIRKRGY